MIYWKIFLSNFVANILGYGGGPATIPLLEREVVYRYEWFSTHEYSEMVALGNGLPGPISTKLAAFIGYDQGGFLGAIIGIFASVAPSLLMMIFLIGLLLKFKDSPKVKKLTKVVRPTIAVLLGVMTYNFLFDSYVQVGWIHTLILVILGYFLLELRKISPTYVVIGALLYGGFFLG